MTVETELEELAALNADLFTKEIKDLSDDEKALIVKHLTIYSLSDNFANICKSVKVDVNIGELAKDMSKKTLDYSQLQRDVLTRDFMEELTKMIDESEGGKAFKAQIARNAKNFTKTIEERIEVGYDAPTFTELDIEKHKKILGESVAVWLSQTINAFEKPQPATEEQGAY